MSRTFLKNIQAILGGFFAVISLPCLILSGYFSMSSVGLLQHGLKTEGVVIQMVPHWSSSSKSRSSGPSYSPLFRFQSEDGKSHTVQSTLSTNPPSFSEGDVVPILYRTTEPQKAIINTFMELWLGPIISGIVGVVFLLVGVGLIVSFIRRRQLQIWLMQHGQRILADVQGVELNRSIKVNNRSPYQIISSWKDPNTQTLYSFKSEDFWDDPTPLIQGRKTIDVLVKADEPKKYWVDTSFLNQT
jgi:hypothetical protein